MTVKKTVFKIFCVIKSFKRYSKSKTSNGCECWILVCKSTQEMVLRLNKLRLNVLFYLRKGLMDNHGVCSCNKSDMFVNLVSVDNVAMLLENYDLFLWFIS